VRGFAQLLASRADCSPDDKEIYQLMLGEVDSATTIIRDFLDMARPTGPKRERCSLGELLQSLVRVLETQALMQHVEIRSVIDPKLTIVGDATQMRQVFLNLAQNAIQAMPDGGRMTVSAELVGDQAVVRVVDTGVGISPANLERLGRPFFTTREGGTGLGLTTCYRIVRAHGGNITVMSELGQGTEFTVQLPSKSRLG
ncbi:MAG: two-component system sensor histidine kinase NtrB, partial [Bacillota bacterium]